MIVRMRLVGGPFDGVSSLAWGDEDYPSPPERALVGRCPGRGICGMQDCSSRSPAHVAYWDVRDTISPPVSTVGYVLVEFECDERKGRGSAQYLFAELDFDVVLRDQQVASLVREMATVAGTSFSPSDIDDEEGGDGEAGE